VSRGHSAPFTIVVNLTAGAQFQSAAEKQYVRVAQEVYSQFSSLVAAQSTRGWVGFIRSFARLVKRLYGIHLVLTNLPKG
jgi:hypothetical protein